MSVPDSATSVVLVGGVVRVDIKGKTLHRTKDE